MNLMGYAHVVSHINKPHSLEGERRLSKNTRLATVKRVFTGKGYSKSHSNAFNAIADFDDRASRLAAGLLGAPTLGLSVLAHDYYQTSQIASKEKDMAMLLEAVLLSEWKDNSCTVGDFIITDNVGSVTVSDGKESFTVDKSIADLQDYFKASIKAAVNSKEKKAPKKIRDLHCKLELQQALLSGDQRLMGPLLKKVLSPVAQHYFSPLLNIETVGRVRSTSPIVLGDSDGSDVRMILAGIVAGGIQIHPDHVDLLVKLMEAEARLLKSLNKLNFRGQDPEYLKVQASKLMREFQGNVKIQQDIAKLAGHLTYHSMDAGLIFIGDCIHDRFACNKEVGRLIREQLKQCGALFITGNHDIYYKNESAQFGSFAKNSASPEEWKEHEDTVLTNAYYCEKTNTLYLHHGIEEDAADNKKIQTAFGDYTMPGLTFDVHHFIDWINAKERRPHSDELVNRVKPDDSVLTEAEYASLQTRVNRERVMYLTRFRPDDVKMPALARKLGIRIVHGHNGKKDTGQAGVVMLNSRSPLNKGLYSVVAIRLGE